jgi:hypothetical protein
MPPQLSRPYSRLGRTRDVFFFTVEISESDPTWKKLGAVTIKSVGGELLPLTRALSRGKEGGKKGRSLVTASFLLAPVPQSYDYRLLVHRSGTLYHRVRDPLALSMATEGVLESRRPTRGCIQVETVQEGLFYSVDNLGERLMLVVREGSRLCYRGQDGKLAMIGRPRNIVRLFDEPCDGRRSIRSTEHPNV